MKIVVLAGGLSTERAVSLVTGTSVCRALRENGHRAVLVDLFLGLKDAPENLETLFDAPDGLCADASIGVEAPDLEAVRSSREDSSDRLFGPNVLELCQYADLVFLALHGSNGEDGKVQAAFDLFGIRYTGTGYLSSAIAMDKALTKQFFREHGVPTPAGISLVKGEGSTKLADYGMSLPVVVKPCCGGSSVGVSIVSTEQEYQEALEQAFSYEEELIVEEYVSGREFSVGVVDGKAYPVIEIAPIEGFYDYTNKYKAGSTVETCPAELDGEKTREMQRYAEEGAAALKIETYCRLDFMMNGEGKIYCLEANTLPGMTPTSLLPQEAQVLGMNFADLCDHLVEISLKKYENPGSMAGAAKEKR